MQLLTRQLLNQAVTDSIQLSLCCASCQLDTRLAKLLTPYRCPFTLLPVNLMHLNGLPLAHARLAQKSTPYSCSCVVLHVSLMHLSGSTGCSILRRLPSCSLKTLNFSSLSEWLPPCFHAGCCCTATSNGSQPPVMFAENCKLLFFI